jgi:glutamine amidotransferase
MIALIDYGIGNLRSVEKALEAVGAEVVLTSEPRSWQPTRSCFRASGPLAMGWQA